jgi:hypothetical protein
MKTSDTYSIENRETLDQDAVILLRLHSLTFSDHPRTLQNCSKHAESCSDCGKEISGSMKTGEFLTS